MRTLLCLVFTALALPAQEPVRYALSFPNAVHHEAEVRATFTGVRQPTLEVLISRSSPGRYSLHEFPKNVYNLKATDGPGSPPHGVPTFRLPMEHLRSQRRAAVEPAAAEVGAAVVEAADSRRNGSYRLRVLCDFPSRPPQVGPIFAPSVRGAVLRCSSTTRSIPRIAVWIWSMRPPSCDQSVIVGVVMDRVCPVVDLVAIGQPRGAMVRSPIFSIGSHFRL